jgi:hypothetical protein
MRELLQQLNLAFWARSYALLVLIATIFSSSGCGDEPVNYYGPAPLYGVIVQCQTDQQCKDQLGPDASCQGGVCLEEPIAYYGPAPYTNDPMS